jgi:small subunit ribosomal protein S8
MDIISDMLIRIKNAQAVVHQTVDVPFSELKLNLAKILEKEGLIEKIETKGRKAKKFIRISLKYENGRPSIKDFKRISKPSCRIYVKKNSLGSLQQERKIAVLSTPQGIMSNKEAFKKGLGGEYLFQVLI